jgi:hypothetical protein
MKQITEGLWQSPAHLAGNALNNFDVVFWMCGGSPIAPWGTILIDYAIPDDPNGLDPAVYADLVALADMFGARNVLTVCAAGENRSGLMSVLTLKARGMPTEAAIKLVQDNGHNTSKGYSFWNPGFNKQVR